MRYCAFLMRTSPNLADGTAFIPAVEPAATVAVDMGVSEPSAPMLYCETLFPEPFAA